MEKGYILTNARGFVRQMCSASHLPQCLETSSYLLLPPPDNNPRQAPGTEEMGLPLHTSGRRLCSQRAKPVFDLT